MREGVGFPAHQDIFVPSGAQERAMSQFIQNLMEHPEALVMAVAFAAVAAYFTSRPGN
jgi:hypothetical protein